MSTRGYFSSYIAYFVYILGFQASWRYSTQSRFQIYAFALYIFHPSDLRRLNPGRTPFLFLLQLLDEVVLANRIGDLNASGA